MLLWKFPMEKWQQMLDLVNLVEYPLEPLWSDTLFTLFTSPPHNLGIVHTSTWFWQATMEFLSSLATKPYNNNVVLI
jgi:hypothetical protein